MQADLPTGRAALAAGLPIDVLQRWLDRRIVFPTHHGRTGEPHRFSAEDVIRLSLIQMLHHVGFSPRDAATIAAKFFEGSECRAPGQLSPAGRTYIVATSAADARVVVVPWGGTVADFIPTSAATVIMQCDAIVDIARNRVEKAA